MKKTLYFLLVIVILSCVTKEPVEIILEMENGLTSQQALAENAAVLKSRLKNIGVRNPDIKILSENKIQLNFEIADINEDRLTSYLLNAGKLEFRETFKADDVAPFLISVNDRLKDLTTTSKEKEIAKDSLYTDRDEINPLFDLIISGGISGSPVIATFALKDTAMVNSYLNMPQIKQLLPENMQFVKFLWSKPEKDSEEIELYALRSNSNGTAILGGDVITDAFQTYDQIGNPAVSIQMNSEGAKIWEELTGKAFKERGNIAIILNDIVYSAPGVSTGAISGGNSEITGSFTLEQAQDLSWILISGKLTPMKIVKEHSNKAESHKN